MELANRLYDFDIKNKNNQNQNNANQFKRNLPSLQIKNGFDSGISRCQVETLKSQPYDSPQNMIRTNLFDEKCSTDRYRILNKNMTTNNIIRNENNYSNQTENITSRTNNNNQYEINLMNVQTEQKNQDDQDKYLYANTIQLQNNNQEKQSLHINSFKPETPFNSESKQIIFPRNKLSLPLSENQNEPYTQKRSSIEQNITQINLGNNDENTVVDIDKINPVSLAKIPGNKSSFQHLDRIWSRGQGLTMNQLNTNGDFQSDGNLNSQRNGKIEKDKNYNGFHSFRKNQNETKPSLNIQNIQYKKNDFKLSVDSRNYLEEELKTIIQRDRSVMLNIKYFVNKISCGKLYNTQEIQLINKAIDRVKQDLDIFMILDRQKEVEKLKKLVLSQDQQILFNFFPKPIISIQKEIPILSRQSLRFEDNNTSTNKISRSSSKKLNLSFKNLGIVTKAVMKFKQNISNNKISDYQQLFLCYERLRLNKNSDDESLMNKKLIDQLGDEMKRIFEIAFMMKHKEQNKFNNSMNEIKISSQNFMKDQKNLKPDGNINANPSSFKFQNEQKQKKQFYDSIKEDNLSHQSQPETNDIIKQQEILSLNSNKEQQIILQQPNQVIQEEKDCITESAADEADNAGGDLNIIKFEEQNDSSLYDQQQ